MAGFWKAPRELARMKAERRLSLSAYALIHFLGESGADRPRGIVTSNGYLAGALDLSERTIRRGLLSLRDRGLIEFEDHPGVATFPVRMTDEMARLVSEVVSEVMSEVTLDTPRQSKRRKPGSEKGKPTAATSDTSRARAETETETEKNLSSSIRCAVRKGEEEGEFQTLDTSLGAELARLQREGGNQNKGGEQ